MSYSRRAVFLVTFVQLVSVVYFVMMRNTGILKWTLHKNKNSSNGRNWQHQSETLTSGHIAYLVKFLGVTEADHPKGIDVIKDCIRKLKLDDEIRRAEGQKTPKAELTISVDGVAIQEPKGKKILYQFPLHQLSYCADDKAEKKYFTFIAKEGESHKCFVFASEKLAEEITLTIGQAFDLAYRRFLDSSGREIELKREIIVLQERITQLEVENSDLKEKILLNPDTDHMHAPLMLEPTEPLYSPPVPPRSTANLTNQLIAEFTMTANEIEKRANADRHLDELFFEEEKDSSIVALEGFEAPPKICPPPKGKRQDGVSNNTSTAGITHHTSDHITVSTSDIFGSDPFFTTDPFGMTNFSSALTAPAGNQSNSFMINSNDEQSVNSVNGNFSSTVALRNLTDSNLTHLATLSNNENNNLSPTNTNINRLNQFSFQQPAAKSASIGSALQILDKRIEEMKLGFSRGILTEDFPSEQSGPIQKS